MKLQVRYETRYLYDEEVSYSPHIFRLFPRADTHVTIERFHFATNHDADIQYRRDLFDNIVNQCFYPERSRELRVQLEADLELRERNAFHFILAAHAAELPFQYEAHERAVLEPFLAQSDDPVIFEVTPGPTVDSLVALNRMLREHLRYERREEGRARTPRETLAAGAGACRDFAVLLAEILRHAGIAARLASGYLVESGGGTRTAEGALHAWTEAYLPGAGWVGLDPTNGTFCDHHHVAAAVGLTPEDVAPISGRFYSDRPVNSSMSASLQLHLSSGS